MKRVLFLGIGIFAVLLGLQMFCVKEVTFHPTVVEKLKMTGASMPVADYLPYSLVCVGVVLFYYGYKAEK